LNFVPSTNTSNHYWMESTANGITKQGTMFNVYDAEYDGASGEVKLTIGPNNLANNDTVMLVEDSLIFTCTMDMHDTEHTYPRATDPAANAALGLAVATANSSIRLQVGKSYSGGFVAPLEMEFIASILENSNV